MAQQLTPRAGGAPGSARTAAGVDKTFTRLVRAEARRAVTPTTVAVMVFVVLLPTVQALVQVSSYQLRDSFDLFDLMISNWLPLLFPLLVTAIHLPSVASDLSHGFTRPARARAPLGQLLASRIAVAAGLAGATFFLAIMVAWFVSFVVVGDTGPITFVPPGPGETSHPIGERTTFSPLFVRSPLLYGLALGGWVGLNAALWSVLGGLALILVGNRFLALAAPTVLCQVIEAALAYARWEGFSISGSVFQTGITQQPAWAPFMQFAALGVLALAATAWVRARRFETAGIE